MTKKQRMNELCKKYLSEGDQGILNQLKPGSELSEQEKRELWSGYVRGFRRFFGLTQTEASSILNIVHNTLISHEMAARTPYMTNAQEIVLNARIFKLIIDEIIEGRMALLKTWEPEKYLIAKSSAERKIDLFVSPLMGRERESLMNMCQLVHKKDLTLDPILQFVQEFFPFINAIISEAAENRFKSEIFIPFRTYLTSNNLICLYAIFNSWLKSRGETGRKEEENDEYFDLFA